MAEQNITVTTTQNRIEGVFPQETTILEEGSIWSGVHASGVVPASYLEKGGDNLGALSFITKGHTRFLYTLSSKFASSRTTNDWFYRSQEITDLDRLFPVMKDQTEPNVLYFHKDKAAQLQPNDILIARQKYVLYEGTMTEPEYSDVFGPDNVISPTKYFIDQEQLFVTNVDYDADIDGNCRVTVRRNYRGHGAKDWAGTLYSGRITFTGTQEKAKYLQGESLMRATPAFSEGSGAPNGFGKNPTQRINWMQQFKYAVEVTKEQSVLKNKLGKSTIETYKMLRMRQASLDIERTFIFGQRGYAHSADGKRISTTGGMIEHILRDKDHIHNYMEICGLTSANSDNLLWEHFLDVGNVIAQDGGSESRNLYCSISLYTEFKKSFGRMNQIHIDKEETAKYDIPVESIIMAGLKFNIIPLYALEEMGYANKAIVIDNGYPSFGTVKFPGYDMMEKDCSPVDKEIIKRQWIGMYGVEAKYLEKQHLIDFTGATTGLVGINNIIK